MVKYLKVGMKEVSNFLPLTNTFQILIHIMDFLLLQEKVKRGVLLHGN